MLIFIIWIIGYALAASLIIYFLKDSDFREASGFPMVIAAALCFGVFSWLFLAFALTELCLHKFGGEDD